jgi:hypothetical protein
MPKGPKGVAQKHSRLPAGPADVDPLQAYCPDLEQWARSWSYEPRDIPPGLQMVECFKPFLRNLLTLDLSRPTLRRHRDNLWVLGGEIIRRLQMDSDLRKQPVEQVVGDLIDDEGGPLLSHGESEAEQRAFDATCRKFARFLAATESSRGSAPNAQPTTSRVNH